MLIVVCDECGKRRADILQLMDGHAELKDSLNGVPVMVKSTTVHLCDIHWPMKHEIQPSACIRIKFVWPKGGPPDPPFVGPMLLPATHWKLLHEKSD